MTLFVPHTTALVAIDLQARVLGLQLAPHTAAHTVELTARLANELRAQGGLLVYVKVAFADDYADALRQPVDVAMPRPAGARGSEGADYAPALAAIAPDVWITKHQWGAFHGTELDLQLRRRGIDTIILTGVATNMGVEQTAREAWQHGYKVLLAEDACSSLSEDMHRFAIDSILPRVSRVRSTAEILANH